MSTLRDIEREHYRRGQEDMAEELNNAAVFLGKDALDTLTTIGIAAGFAYWEDDEA